MRLREYLEKYTKVELLNQARSFALRGYSRLKKADLIDKIIKTFCEEKMIRSRLTCLTNEQMDLLRKACIEPQDISIHQVMDGMQLHRYWIGYFENPSDKFCVFEEIKEVFNKIDDNAFRIEQKQKGWLMKCVKFFIEYYGIAPLEVIHKMYKLKVKCAISEMTNMLWGMPVDIVESCIFPMDKLGLEGWPKNHPIYSDIGLLIHIPILENNKLDSLLEQQGDKNFYIPSAQQINEICKIGYEASSRAYRELEAFFKKKLSFSYERTVSFCLQVWVNSYEGNSPAQVINQLAKVNIVFENEQLMNEFMDLLMTAYNNTRLKENRGHSPSELEKREVEDETPTVIPMAIFPEGLNGVMIESQRKVYPNDPCPCGSGKKYKKCCGKKK